LQPIPVPRSNLGLSSLATDWSGRSSQCFDARETMPSRSVGSRRIEPRSEERLTAQQHRPFWSNHISARDSPWRAGRRVHRRDRAACVLPDRCPIILTRTPALSIRFNARCPMSQLGPTRISSLGAARPLPPSADIDPGGQSVGQAAQFCLSRPRLGAGRSLRRRHFLV
jgi:hypothetical protein